MYTIFLSIIYSLIVLRGPFRYRNDQDAVSGHRLAREGTGITHWSTVAVMLRSDATSSRQLPTNVVSTLSAATRSRTRQGPSDPWKSRRSPIPGLHNPR